MPSVTGTGWTVICLLLWKPVAAQSGDLRCSVVGPGGALHPVQGLLERFEAGPGCAARGHGKKETHIISVGKVTNPENKVTVLLKPLSLTPSPIRPLHLLLSSKRPVTWWLEAERLPPSLPVLVQVSSNSSVQSHSLRFRVQMLRLLPFRPRALLRWALKHHGNISSLTHATYGNRVYIGLGEDPTLPAVCQLQPLFLSHNYMTSDLQPQEVQGCVHAAAGAISPEVHVIKLHSAGSGLCGSLQVEVVVSLVPPVDHSKPQRVVLILSSSMPVNWAISARGVQGDVSVHSSNSVSPPFPPEPDLTVSSTLVPDLSIIADLLVWTRESGYTKVSSYTEADLANRFVIQLAGHGTGAAALMRPLWAEERRLRQWLTDGGQDSFGVRCEDGLFSVTVDQHLLQGSSDQVAAVTLRDPACQAQSNGSHFLLVFPVISCGTDGLLLGQSRGVQYKNMISAQGPLTEVVELKSCVVSPLSDPKKSPFWFVIKEGCSSDPALSLSGARTEEEEEEEEEGVEGRGTVGETGDTDEGRSYHRDGRAERRQEEPRGMTESDTNMGEEREMPLLRFSFVLRSVFKDSMQFVHCSLRLCDSTRDESTRETVKNDCLGRLRIPALVSKSPGHKCDIRNLSRPVVVTQSMSSLAPKAPRPPVGQRTKRLSLAPVASPDPEDISSVVQTGPVIGIVFLAFMMGVGLMGAVWCIYNSTAPQQLNGCLCDQMMQTDGKLSEDQSDESSHRD
ncbi:Transforming growth factor beta receptor type 3 [Channa argus]|uniref:Transforming growth factor beta receptor type 3 n=1 Tax=Channa argus TaxID=215402 RepID=A0A6G1QEB8_CHAAH|nr:Transforming growth factor beta receptor type 3 [Channa argus]